MKKCVFHLICPFVRDLIDRRVSRGGRRGGQEGDRIERRGHDEASDVGSLDEVVDG